MSLNKQMHRFLSVIGVIIIVLFTVLCSLVKNEPFIKPYISLVWFIDSLTIMCAVLYFFVSWDVIQKYDEEGNKL